MGTPHDQVWPDVSRLSNFSLIRFTQYPGEDLRERFSFMDEQGFDLMMKMLVLDPKQRISAKEALNHQYFNE